MNPRFLTVAALLGVFLTGGILPSVSANPQAPKKATKAKTVYVCKGCKMHYSTAVAKKMSYKDPMGHKLTRSTKVPAGYKMGTEKGQSTAKKPEEQPEKTADKQASTMKCPVCKSMDMTSTMTANNTQEVKIKGKTWYCCSGCDMSEIADKP